jgi:2-polyprenyl-6-methoxyphenol hydroxylase-like FAD-dependent oxidoreductase
MQAGCDVAIAGYGPVGQLVAILLGQKGWRVQVLERWPEPYPLPRAVHFDHEVARILQGAGVMDALRDHTETATIYEWRNAGGELLLRLGRESVHSVSGWPADVMFCQPKLEEILDARARSLPSVRVERGVAVVGAVDAGDRVEISARRANGEAVALGARYLVGCDGANSTVRSVLGSKWCDLGFHFDWLVVDVVPHEPRPFDPLNWQLCDPARPTTLVSGGPGRRRWEFMRLPHETLDELNREETAWRLLEPWGVRPDCAALERHTVYTFRACWADTWRRGRTLIAGDAAHLMPPFAGQGMCSGLRDAANLAWKLDLVLAGRAPEDLLDSYPSERIPHVRSWIDLSVALGKVICVADPEEAAERDLRMIAAARSASAPDTPPPPRLGPGCTAPATRAAGSLFVQGRVRRGAALGRFDDVVGAGFALVSPHGDPASKLDRELLDYFASIGGITAHVAPEAPIVDVDGDYARWFGAQGVGLALQRPDFAVFGTAPGVDGAGSLVAALRAALAAPYQ